MSFLRIALRTLAMRVMLIPEWCRDCGRTIQHTWNAPNRLWVDVMGENAGPRCIRCFDKRARRRGWWLIWEPVRMDGWPWPWDL